MKHLKQVVKNLSESESGDVLFRRHVNLAYQWIKRKNLTLAENPKTSRSNVDYRLLVKIINFFSEIKTSENEMVVYLKANGYKIPSHRGSRIKEFTTWNTFMEVDESIFNNTYFCYLHSLYNEMNDCHIFWYIRRFLRDLPMNPKIELMENVAILTFTSKYGSSLVLTIEKNAVADSFVQYYFVLKSKVQSQGVMNLNTGTWTLDNKTLDLMINELLTENKFGGLNEKK